MSITQRSEWTATSDFSQFEAYYNRLIKERNDLFGFRFERPGPQLLIGIASISPFPTTTGARWLKNAACIVHGQEGFGRLPSMDWSMVGRDLIEAFKMYEGSPSNDATSQQPTQLALW